MRLELVPQSARFPIRGQLGGGLLLLLLGDGLEVVRLFIEWWSLSLSISVPQYFFMRWRRVSNISKPLSEMDCGRFSQANLCTR